jgi:hypothetical protein
MIFLVLVNYDFSHNNNKILFKLIEETGWNSTNNNELIIRLLHNKQVFEKLENQSLSEFYKNYKTNSYKSDRIKFEELDNELSKIRESM